MNKSEFYHQLAYRTDTTPNKAKLFVKAFEEQILEIIALEDKIQLEFGTIGGMTKEPVPARGYVRDTLNNEWTNAKFGYPYIKWSKKALDCTKQKGDEYLKERGLTELFEEKYKYDEKKKEVLKKNLLNKFGIKIEEEESPL